MASPTARRRPRHHSLAFATVAAALSMLGTDAVMGEEATSSAAPVPSAPSATGGATPTTPTAPDAPTSSADAGGNFGEFTTDGASAIPGGVATSSVAPGSCAPVHAPVDPEADPATVCLAARLDDWSARGVMGVGQEVNVSSDEWRQPLDLLEEQGHRVAVVGFDLEELRDADELGKPRVEDLARYALDHDVVLTASWHADNPFTGGPFNDRRDQGRLGDLLTDGTAAQRFWAEWSDMTGLLARLGSYGVPVVVRPLHEAGGDWFWWGQPDPTAYRQLFAQVQERTAAAGVHSVLWAYGGAVATREPILDPASLLPDRVDLAGLDSYDCDGDACGYGQSAADVQREAVDLRGYADLAARAPRVALTEVGPQESDGDWDPAVVSQALRDAGQRATWALFWFDDSTGRKQLSSLKGAGAWLDGCPDGLCPL